MIGGASGIDRHLCNAQLTEEIAAFFERGRFLERAAQIHDRRVRCPLRQRATGRTTKRLDHKRIARGNRPDEIRRRLLQPRATLEKNLGRPTMGARPLVSAHLLEHSSTDDRVRELDRVLVPQQVGADERARRRQRGFRVEAAERGGERQLGPVTENRCRAEQAGGIGVQAGQASCDAARDRLRPELEHTRRLLGRRGRPLPPERIEQRNEKERIPSRARLQRCAEDRVRLDPQALAGERRCRFLTEAARMDHNPERVGE